jgi:uncharacterized protein (DUF305 family)
MRFKLLFAVAITLSATAFAQSDHATMPHDPAAQELMDANQAMVDAMADMQPTGDTDKDFIEMMIVHHEGAIAMAKVVLEHGDDPDVRSLAETIIESQAAEVAWMRDWLARQP